VAIALHETWPDFPQTLLTVDELIEALRSRYPGGKAKGAAQHGGRQHSPVAPSAQPGVAQSLISIQHLVHYYMRGTPLVVKALHDINLEIRQGEIVGIIGHTGSGKSTAVQHFNGLLRPHEGAVTVVGIDMADPNVDLKSIRRQVGLVFQFPEAQLFEQFVGDDIAYGPRNLKLNREEVRARVRKAMAAVGLEFEAFKDRLTFSLSGGQMRRVALAGVLALEPDVLVLDEPTAGLDPQGRRQLLDHLLALHKQGVTLVMISHNMEELAAICDRLVVIADGRTVLEGPPGEIFAQSAYLRELGLDVPAVTAVFDGLIASGVIEPVPTVYTQNQAIATLRTMLATVQASAVPLDC